jgi:hypothetical protein
MMRKKAFKISNVFTQGVPAEQTDGCRDGQIEERTEVLTDLKTDREPNRQMERLMIR